MDNLFNINFYVYVGDLLPTLLRKPRMVHWLFCLIKPMVNLHQKFLQYRRKALYKIEHTPQIYAMVQVFNDAFDPIQKRIRIIDGDYKSAVYFYEPEENKPVHFFEPNENKPVHFFEPEEIEMTDVDFIILLPEVMTLSTTETIRLKALCDYYRSPDKTYQIR